MTRWLREEHADSGPAEVTMLDRDTLEAALRALPPAPPDLADRVRLRSGPGCPAVSDRDTERPPFDAPTGTRGRCGWLAHRARLIELPHAAAVSEGTLTDPGLPGHVPSATSDRAPTGVAILDAPRGVLIHHDEVATRAFAPRLSRATHALRLVPLQVDGPDAHCAVPRPTRDET